MLYSSCDRVGEHGAYYVDRKSVLRHQCCGNVGLAAQCDLLARRQRCPVRMTNCTKAKRFVQPLDRIGRESIFRVQRKRILQHLIAMSAIHSPYMQIGVQGEATIRSNYRVTPSFDFRVHVAHECNCRHVSRVVKRFFHERLSELGNVRLVDDAQRTGAGHNLIHHAPNCFGDEVLQLEVAHFHLAPIVFPVISDEITCFCWAAPPEEVTVTVPAAGTASSDGVVLALRRSNGCTGSGVSFSFIEGYL